MRRKTASVSHSIYAILLLLYHPGVFAHHSITGEFDTSKPIQLSGSITKLEWFNPHIWFYLDVKSDSGVVEKWQCEMGSPNQLIRAGWKAADLPVGTVINVDASPARDGSHTCSTNIINLENGTQIFSRFGR